MKKLYSLITIILTTVLLLGSVHFVLAAGTDRELTNDEKAAFIVRDEWTSWVKDFTASLSELDQIATAKIYDDMDFYDMQYRFTEKYKKVPEYLDEDGKPTQKLKDLIKIKRKQLNGANIRDYLCFTSRQDGSTVSYSVTGSLPSISIGISTDGTSFEPWTAGTVKTLKSGDSIWVLNKSGTLSTGTSNYFKFNITGNIEASGDIESMINYKALTDYCFYNLFNGQTALKKAPNFSSTTLAQNCYNSMFRGCTGLTTAPSLSATTLAASCYDSMFYGCTGLTTAPSLPATTLAATCYQNMFNGCSNLNSMSISYTGNFSGTGVPTNAFNNWVSGVADTGSFAYNGYDITYGSSAIPKDSTNKWTMVRNDYFRFISRKDGSQVGYMLINGLVRNQVWYSKDRINWVNWDGSFITLNNGETLYVHNRESELSYYNGSVNQIFRFNVPSSSRIEVAGNIMSLIDYGSLYSCCFMGLLEVGSYSYDGGRGLISAKDLKLPAATLTNRCYWAMFTLCTNLEYGPELPATNLASECYNSLFYGCSSLKEIKLGYTGDFNSSYFINWVSGVNTVGTLYYNGTDTTKGVNAIPTNWTVRGY